MDHEKSLNNILFDILVSPGYTFYSLFLAELNKEFTSDSKIKYTLTRHLQSGGVKLRINRDYWEHCCPTKSSKKFILLHELLHLINEHVSIYAEKTFPDKQVSAIAFDLFVNQQINEERPIDPATGNRDTIELSDFPELGLLPNESSYYYYIKLLQAKEQKNNTGSSGSKNLDKILGESDESGENPGEHQGWDEFVEISDFEKQLIRKELESTLERIADETQKAQGTVPAWLLEKLKNKIEPEKPILNWRVLFNRFVGSCVTSEQYSTRKRPNMRFEDSPSYKYKEKVKGFVGCDSSGSMSDYDIEQINSQLHHIWKAGVGVDFASWDGDCEPHKKYDGRLTFERTKAGGTRISCAIEYVNEHYKKNNWTFAVIGTDGYVEHDIVKCRIPCLIIITKTGNIDLNTKHPIIKIN